MMVWFLMGFEDSVSAVRSLATGAQGFSLEVLNCLTSLVVETKRVDHRYQTHSEWHTDSKFVGLLKVGYQTSILEIKF